MGRSHSLTAKAKAKAAPAEPRVVMRPIAELAPYERNARVHSPEQIDQIARSIREFGFTNPVLVDASGGIIAGHGRVDAARKLGMTAVPCIGLEHLSEEQVRAYIIADNKLALNSEWDEELLRLELGDLKLGGYDLSLTGFSDIELGDLFAERGGGLTDPDAVPEPPPEPITRSGDVWLLGRHRLVCGDATSEVDMSLALGGVKPAMVLTDPPYGMSLDTDFSGAVGSLRSAGRRSGTRGKRYDPIIGDNDDFTPELIEAVFVAGRDARETFLFGADYYAELLPDKNNGSWLVWDKRKESQSEAIGSEFELIWSKRRHKRRMLRHDWFGFLSSSNPQEARSRVHPAQKPSSLLVDIIEQWGVPAEAVYDPFVGSGTTIIAAEMTGRACHALEIAPTYVDTVIIRWQNFTGKFATLSGDGRTFVEIGAERAVPVAAE
jgi:DNA modification methylase